MGNNAGPESKRGTGKRKMCIFVLLAKKITIFLCVFSSFSFSHCSCFDFRPFLSGSLFFLGILSLSSSSFASGMVRWQENEAKLNLCIIYGEAKRRTSEKRYVR